MAARRPASPVLTIAGWNAVSRGTGFVRVVAVGAVLGATFLGNTYQQANLVSTVLFEVLAAGLLSVPLVPALVARPSESRALVSALWGLSLACLGGLALLLAVLGRPVMTLLTSAAPAEVAARQVELGAFLLWLFAPQLVLYAAGALSTAWLHAENRFAAAAAAPVANNLVVIITMGAFLLVERGDTTLPVGPAGRWVLGIGTTLGVAAMAALPTAAAVRRGFSLRPAAWWGRPAVARVAREGVWAGALLGAQQILLTATLVLANRVEGGVVASQVAYTFFLLPQALLAHPVYTAAFPVLAGSASGGDYPRFLQETKTAARRLVLLLSPAFLGVVIVAPIALRVVRIGAFDAAGAALATDALRAYVIGLLPFGLYMLLCRAWAALGRTRVAGLGSLAAAAFGVGMMFVGSMLVDDRQVVTVLALSHSAAMTAAAGALAFMLVRTMRQQIP